MSRKAKERNLFIGCGPAALSALEKIMSISALVGAMILNVDVDPAQSAI